LLVVVALISGCGDPVENAIEGLIAGGDQAEKARMELNLAKRAAIAPIEAGADPLSFALCRASVAPSIDDRLPEDIWGRRHERSRPDRFWRGGR
jgi:hypothetical protein